MKLSRSLWLLPLVLAGCADLLSAPKQTGVTRSVQQPTTQVATGSAATTYMYVLDGLSQTIDEVNIKTMKVSKSILTTGLYPNQLVTVGAKSYLVNSGDADIDVLDLHAHAKLDNILLRNGSNPMTLTLLDDNKGLVINYVTRDLAWIDMGTKALEATASVGPGAPGGYVAVVNGKAYVETVQADYSHYPTIGFTASSVVVVDLASRQVVKTIALNNDDNPFDVSLDPNGKIEVGVKNGVAVIDPATDALLRRIDFGTAVSSIRYLSATKAYAAAGGGMVSFNPTTGAILRDTSDLIASGGGNFKIFGNAAYVTNFASNSIRVIDLATETASGSDLSVGNGPQDLAFVTIAE